jgi:peptidoglycan biosynthesis protein MviN/MurJ (putative lipid II flippase)
MSLFKALGKCKKGEMGGGVAGIAIGVVLVAILLIAVAYPIIVDVVSSANTTGRTTDALIIKYLPTAVLIIALVALFAYLYMRK